MIAPLPRRGWRIGLQARFAIGAVLAIMLMSLVNLLLVKNFDKSAWESAERQSAELLSSALREQLELRATGLALNLAESLINPVYRHDLELAKDLLRTVDSQAGVEHVYLLDVEGTVIHDGTDAMTAYGMKLASPGVRLALTGETPKAWFEGKIISVATPIRIGSQSLGAVVLTIDDPSVARRTAQIVAMQESTYGVAKSKTLQANMVATTALLLVALGVFYLLVRGIARPILGLRRRMENFALGSEPMIPSRPSNDEIGDLVLAFERLAGELRKQTVSRDTLDAILNAMTDCLFVADSKGTIEFANIAARRKTGLAGNPSSRPSIQALVSREAGPLPDLAAIARDRAREIDEFALRKSDGTTTPITLSVASIPSEAPGATRYVCVARDVSAWKVLVEELRAAQMRAQEANQSKSRFLAGMSHELRTPLNAILGFSEAMRHMIFGPIGHPKYAEYAADIHFSGTHLLGIINDLLDLAKVEEGKMELHPVAIDIGEIVEETIKLVAGRATQSGITLETDIPPDLPRIMADGRLLRQVLINLLTNATKFTPTGGEVTLSAAIAPSGELIVAVEDTGIGIPSADLERVMEPYQQAESAITNKKPEGTGPGLPLSRAFMRLHGGDLKIESAPGVGTTVTAIFPSAIVMGAHRSKQGIA